MKLDALKSGGKAALARVLAEIERNPGGEETIALLDAAHAAPLGQVIGLTGPPGVGKSTLAGALIKSYRAMGRSVGVIAIDPSSKRSGGALLGDRTRLKTDPDDRGVFVRSMAARDQLGGLAEITYAAMVLMRALYDIVLIETVGVGQSETDIELAADTIVFCVQPGSGDALQFMKAGIVEIPDIVVVTKGDMGRAATRAKADVKGALGLSDSRQDLEGWQAPVLIGAALSGEGVADLIVSMDDHANWLLRNGRLEKKRRQQTADWLRQSIKDRWGREGLERLSPRLPQETAAPFRTLHDLGRF